MVIGGFDIVLASNEPTMFRDPFFGIGFGFKLAEVARTNFPARPRHLNAPMA
jgi:hypothetical protein